MSSEAEVKYRPDGEDSEEKVRTPSPDPPSPPKQPKDPRSRFKYNPLFRIFFFWVDPLFFYGCCNDLKQSDLYANPSEADSSALTNQFNIYWSQELSRKAAGRKPRLWMVLAKSFKWRFLLQAILAFVEVAMLIGQSLLLGELVDYFTDVTRDQVVMECGNVTLPEPSFSTRNAYLAAFGLLMLALLVAMIHAHYALVATKIGMMARIMTTSAVYHKILKLSQTTISDLTVGHVINVVSNDVQRFDLAFLFLPFLWIAPLHIIVFTYLVYQEVGWVVFVTLFFFVIQIPGQLVLAKIFTKFRFKSALQTDKRVRVMNEVITGIRVIKMYAWEYAFKRVITAIRKQEIRLIKIGGMIRTLTASFNFGVALTLFMAITFLTYVGTGNSLTPRKVIITLSLLTFLRNISASFLIRSVFLLFEAKVAFTRIQNILEQEEMTPEEIQAINTMERGSRNKLDKRISREGYFRPESPWLPGLRKVKLTSVTPAPKETPPPEAMPTDVPKVVPPALQSSIKVSGLTASWSNDEEKPTLKDLSLEVNKQKSFLAVVGRVGAGKSSLLQCLMGELKALRGQVEVNGRVSYASQVPWVFSGTLRENILFGSEFNKERYDRVIDACALKQDIHAMVDGDLTLVGERGVTLSGGQKARVNLARAVYHDADIYLLDDPLSAVDTAVGKQIFEKCIRGLLLRCQVVLVTHQVQFAIRAHQLLVLNQKGEVDLYHTYEELVEKGIDQHELLKMLKDKGAEYVYDDVNDEEEGEEIFDHLEPLPMVDEYDEDEEGEGNDFFPPPTASLRMNSITADRTYRSILVRQDSIDARRAAGLEESITSLSRQRYTSLHRDDNILGSLVETHGAYLDGGSLGSNGKDEVDDPDGLNEDKAQGTISIKTYFNFFRAGANYLVLLIILVLFFLAEAGVVASDIWLSEWSNCDVINISVFEACERDVNSICYLTQDQRMGIYGGITLVSIILNFVRTALFYLVCVNASRVLHNRMFKAIIHTATRFFDTNPSGRVLNRFSKDIGFLDDLLPHTFLEYLFLLLKFLAVLVTASYGNPYILIPAAFIVVAFVSLRWYYLKTSRDIKRLEAVARSPVYSHFSITLQGLSTIRTLGKQPVTQYLFHKYQNQHTQGWYLYLVTSRWFGMRIDLISALYLGVVAFISIPLAQSLDAGIIGLGLAYTIALAGILQYCVRQSAEVENIMISTERIMSYGQLKPEASLESSPDKAPPEGWPQKGEIEMDNVRFRYASTLPYVINHLNFSIKPSEKVGIVGRTGAGKSSLISVLFRLAEPEGDVTIDDVDAESIGLHDLRGKMSIIPQDPVLFSGTMRYNLDPLNQYADDKLWHVLEQVQMKGAVEEMAGGLDEEVSEGGSNFSVGQKQLICLARALLKENKILILDEATANVDPGTDEIIQQTIRTNFKDCTVLTIAHRLNTIMDSDRIMVMSRGRVVEFDTPYELLQKDTSELYRMVEKTGPEASRQLHGMVKRPSSS